MIQKAEVEATTRDQESKRRTQAGMSEKLVSEVQAKSVRAADQTSANSPVTSPHGQLPTQHYTTAKGHSPILERATRVSKKSQTNGSAYKSSSNSSSSSEASPRQNQYHHQQDLGHKLRMEKYLQIMQLPARAMASV